MERCGRLHPGAIVKNVGWVLDGTTLATLMWEGKRNMQLWQRLFFVVALALTALMVPASAQEATDPAPQVEAQPAEGEALAEAAPAPGDPNLTWGVREYQMGFQEAVTPVKERVDSFNDFLLVLIIAITIFVFVLLAIVIVRYNSRANPTPRTFSHHAGLEVAWTVVPAVIVLVIMSMSVPLIGLQNNIPEGEEAQFTVKAIGHTWAWSYVYQGEEEGDPVELIPEIASDPLDTMADDSYSVLAGKPRLLGTTNPLVLPANAAVRIQTTSSGVLHSFAVPAFGIKKDAVPGRLNETWVKVTEPGTYYGQCSELCGEGHAYMPIEVEVVPQETFDAWVACMGSGDIPVIEALDAVGLGDSAMCLASVRGASET